MAFDLKSWVYGLKLSLAGKGLPFAVDFARFNGVVLRRLPYWDLEKYPHAYITVTETATLLYAADTAAYGLGVEDVLYIGSTTEGGIHVNYCTWELTDNGWVQTKVDGSGSWIQISKSGLIWCNTDVLESDGSTVLSASKPIPVYGGA